MTEPTITCPKCKEEIKLTESLAAPIIDATRREYEKRIEAKNEEFAQQLITDRQRISVEEAKKAKIVLAIELDQKTQEISSLQETLNLRSQKLAEAQKAQAEFSRKQRELDDAKRELDLTIEKGVQEGLASVQIKARKDAEEGFKLKVAERELTIQSLQKKIDELQKKAEQGSQQLQGEVLEDEIEELLKVKFPWDKFEAIPKGEFGGDLLQHVVGRQALACGTILWEFKRTKNWSDSWLTKLRDDQRKANAELSVIVSQILPGSVESFDLVDGVWVTHPKYVVPVTIVLRQILVDVSIARQTSEGQETKMEMVYQYLTGTKFRQRVEAIVEGFSSMQMDLDKEKRAINAQWAKREEQINRVMHATVGLYGDLQGIAGKSLKEIDGLDVAKLNPPRSDTEE